jgi:ectoine hydroxylase-related dioxygenase (phytanoyl-CoA dioxygenase family)
MGEIPVLSVISLIYTPTNDSTVGPQKFHRDMNCASQVHLIVNIEDVDEDNGPFTFISGAQSARIIRAIGHSDSRVGDEAIRRYVSNTDLIKCVGRAGTAFYVNPYACFHFGARAQRKPRYILILNYTSKFEWGEGLGSIYRSANRRVFDNGTALRQQLLALSS